MILVGAVIVAVFMGLLIDSARNPSRYRVLRNERVLGRVQRAIGVVALVCFVVAALVGADGAALGGIAFVGFCAWFVLARAGGYARL